MFLISANFQRDCCHHALSTWHACRCISAYAHAHKKKDGRCTWQIKKAVHAEQLFYVAYYCETKVTKMVQSERGGAVLCHPSSQHDCSNPKCSASKRRDETMWALITGSDASLTFMLESNVKIPSRQPLLVSFNRWNTKHGKQMCQFEVIQSLGSESDHLFLLSSKTFPLLNLYCL